MDLINQAYCSYGTIVVAWILFSQKLFSLLGSCFVNLHLTTSFFSCYLYIRYRIPVFKLNFNIYILFSPIQSIIIAFSFFSVYELQCTKDCEVCGRTVLVRKKPVSAMDIKSLKSDTFWQLLAILLHILYIHDIFMLLTQTIVWTEKCKFSFSSFYFECQNILGFRVFVYYNTYMLLKREFCKRTKFACAPFKNYFIHMICILQSFSFPGQFCSLKCIIISNANW